MKTFSEQGIKEHDEAIRLEAFEAGYTQGHNDTVESCVRDYKEASSDYILSAEPAQDDGKPDAFASAIVKELRVNWAFDTEDALSVLNGAKRRLGEAKE